MKWTVKHFMSMIYKLLCFSLSVFVKKSQISTMCHVRVFVTHPKVSAFIWQQPWICDTEAVLSFVMLWSGNKTARKLSLYSIRWNSNTCSDRSYHFLTGPAQNNSHPSSTCKQKEIQFLKCDFLVDLNDSVQTTDQVKYCDTVQGKKC